jgi:glycyl-tRNA synthetase
VLKENIKNLWIKNFVQKRKDMTLLDAAILMNPQVWVASGHVGGFSDPLIDDKNTKERFRADKLLEDAITEIMNETKTILKLESQTIQSGQKIIIQNSVLQNRIKNISQKKDLFSECFDGDVYLPISSFDKIDESVLQITHDYLFATYGVPNLVPESWSLESQAAVMRGEGVKNPNTGAVGDWTEVRKFNLMFQTNQGITQDSSTVVYMRPETAQGIFVNFANIARSSRKKVPF